MKLTVIGGGSTCAPELADSAGSVYPRSMQSESANPTAAAYEDDAVAWPPAEPADDCTAVSLLAFAVGAARE